MSHDVFLQASENERSFIDVERVETVLRALGFEQSPNWCMPDPHLEVYFSVIGADGESSEALALAKPQQINEINTHTTWEAIRSPEKGHAVRWLRQALARELGWVLLDCQTDKIVRPVTGSRFGVATGTVAAKGSIPMWQYAARREETSRPKGRIVAKDGNDGNCRGIVANPLGGWLCGLDSPYTGSPRSPVLQFRDQAFALTAEIAGVGAGPLAVHPTQPWLLAGGPSVRGEDAEIGWVDLESRTVRKRFPLRRPFAWDSDASFVARSPHISVGSYDGTFAEGDPIVPAALMSERWNAIFENRTRRLIRVNLDQDTAAGVHDQQPLKDAYGAGPEHLALSSDRGTLFVGTHNDLCALDAKTGELSWRRTLGIYNGSSCFHWIRGVAVSVCGQWVAAVGGETDASTPDACVVLDTRDGTTVLALALKEFWRSTPNSVIWHPNGWLAVGSDSGAVAFVDLAGTVRTFKAAPKGVKALAFSRDARQLVVGGTETQLRVYELLVDE